VATLVIDAAGGGFGFAGAVDLAVGPAGDVYAVGESSDNVLKLDTGFGISEVIGSAGDGMGNGLNSPDAVAVAPDGTVYVAGSDPSTSDLVIFAIYPDSSIELFHSAPSGAIRDLAVSSGGLLLAALDSEVALFEPDGTPGLPLVTAAGDGTHPLATAAKIAVDPVDDVYVAGVFSDNALRARLAALAAPALPVWGAPALVAGVLLGSGAVRRLRSRAS
jgi:DNA-binding beta-propeller fold protein YncE